VDDRYQPKPAAGPAKAAGSQPSRGPLQEPKTGVDAKSAASAVDRPQAQAIAGILKKAGYGPENLKELDANGWKMVLSAAKLKSLPNPETLAAAVKELAGESPAQTPLKVRRSTHRSVRR
jgi:hypothetical protein